VKLYSLALHIAPLTAKIIKFDDDRYSPTFFIRFIFIRITKLKIVKFLELFKNHPEAQESAYFQIFESHENTVQKYIMYITTVVVGSDEIIQDFRS